MLVEVLWRFNASAQSPSSEASSPSPTTSATSVFRHGPPPSFGLKQMLAEDSECHLYLMVLEGPLDALFPTLRPAATKRSIIKVGISKDPQRRQRELNVSFPKGATTRWVVRTSRPFASIQQAYEAEGILLERLVQEGQWISGEFAIVPETDLGNLLGQ